MGVTRKSKDPRSFFLLSLASHPTHLLANFNVAITCHTERRKGKREASEVAIVAVLANGGGGGEQAHTTGESIFKLLRSPGIYSKESIPPAYVAWRAGTTTIYYSSSIPYPHSVDCSKIPALVFIYTLCLHEICEKYKSRFEQKQHLLF